MSRLPDRKFPPALPEEELLLCCSRVCLDAESHFRVGALAQKDLDWGYLCRMAHANGILPFLYWHLKAVCPAAVPQGILDQLQHHFHTNACRNLALAQELAQLLRLLEANGIPAVSYKGPMLAMAVYGNLALRQVLDLDILIRAPDTPRAVELLRAHGYQSQDHLTGPKGETDYACRLRQGASGIAVELHWGFTLDFFDFRLDLEQLWTRLQPALLGGARVLALAPEDLLLVLCVHLSKHCWEQKLRLAWVCDIAELIRSAEGMDWGKVQEQAGQLGSECMLNLGLFLAADLLGTSLPEPLCRRLEGDPVVQALAARARRWPFAAADPFADFDFSVFLSRSAFYLGMRERLPDRARYCLHYLSYGLRWAMVPNEEDRAWVRLPSRCSFLYFLLRPVRLVAKHRMNLVKYPLKLWPLLKLLVGRRPRSLLRA